MLKYGEPGEEIKSMEVSAGSGVFLPKGLRVKWVWPEVRVTATLAKPQTLRTLFP